ncbi:MAG: aconitate hydratase AcnA, partial [Alphaproteobacteria bacterium]|nr:aconitate hydratase AcnA [Alphaproteobacteria bacterium]
ATCGFFPIDDEVLRYLRFTGRDEDRVALVESYAKEQGMWREPGAEPLFTDTLHLDMGAVEPCISGPKRPQDRILLKESVASFANVCSEEKTVPVEGADYELKNGDVVIAAITSCTNTSNPSVLIAAGLVAKKAREKGLSVKPWVKTSLAPGSQVVTDYLKKAGLQDDLDALGFDLVGYGCTTCIGNSGPLPAPIAQAVEAGDLTVTSVLSGNRNFEGRINPHVKANYLASPPLVVAYAIAGSMAVDMVNDSLGQDRDGNEVYLKDIWPTNAEIAQTVSKALTPAMFRERYADVFKGPEQWQAISSTGGQTYAWSEKSTYIQNPPFFGGIKKDLPAIADIENARCMALLGDSVTTDHISPAGSFKPEHPAGQYLVDHGVAPRDFNSYGSRRGNDRVMTRGTFANIRIKNEMLDGVEGGYTAYVPSGEQMSIYDAAMKYQESGTPLVVIGGKEYGTGSSRDWAAKGTRLLGVKAVIVESFERIHRSNLVGMGVLPLQFKDGTTRKTLGLTGRETFSLSGIAAGLKPRAAFTLRIAYEDGTTKDVPLLCRLDTADEVDYYRNGGILHYVLRQLAG